MIRRLDKDKLKINKFGIFCRFLNLIIEESIKVFLIVFIIEVIVNMVYSMIVWDFFRYLGIRVVGLDVEE